MDANRRWLKVFVALGCLVGSLLACYNPTPTAEPSSSPAPEPTETPEQAVASPVPEEPTSAPSPTAEDATLAPEPIVSPEVEGFVIAYTKGGSLWLSEDGAAPRQLTSGGLDGRPILSPDGQWVVFEREAGVGAMGLPRFDLWVVGVDGSDLHRLVAVADLPGETVTASDSDDEILLDRVPMQVAWLPGSNALAFNTQLMVEHGMAPKDDLWRVGVDSQGLTQVLPDGQGGVFAFSPDGAHLAVSTPSEVSMMNADGGNRRALVDFDFVDTASEYAFYPMPAWAPDGSSALVAISSPEPFSDAIPTADVWRLPVDGAALQLATLSGTFLFSAMGDSLWSADRTRVGYTVAAEVWSNERTLVISDLDGGHATEYATGDLEFVGWADQGEYFAFRDRGSGQFFVGRVGQAADPLVQGGGSELVVSLEWVGADTVVYTVAGQDTFTLWRQRIGEEPYLVDTTGGTIPTIDVLP